MSHSWRYARDQSFNNNSESSQFIQSTDNQRFPADKTPRNEMQSAAAISPLHRSVAHVSSRVRPAFQEAIDMHDSSLVIDCLLSLPNELLVSVALYLCGSKTILDLSCVNKRLRGVAQDAMIRKLCVPKNGVRRVLEMLAANADAASKVRHLDLTECEHGRNNHDQAQLVALLPSLKELTIWLPPHSDSSRARPLIRAPEHQHTSIVPIQGLTLEIMQQSLQVLTVQSDPKYKRSAAHIIRLPGFRKLRTLIMSMEHLGMPSMMEFYRSDGSLIEARQDNAKDRDTGKFPCLPLTIKSLHLTSCTRHTFALLHVFDNLASGQLHLKHITLAFDMPAVSAIILCSASHAPEPLNKKACRWLQRLANLAHKCHHVHFLTSGTLKGGRRRSSVPEELEAVAKLSSCEIALAAGESLRFSDCAARSQWGFRTRSSLEHKFFILHGVSYLQLFCSPTFDITKWIDVAFFHGDRGASWDSDTGFNLKASSVITNKRKLSRVFSRSTPTLIDLSTFEFSFRTAFQHDTRLQPLPDLISALSVIISLLAMSRPQPSKRLDPHRKNIMQEQAQSSLVFNGVVGHLKDPLDFQSKFVVSSFVEEDWTWYLQPRVPPEAVERSPEKTGMPLTQGSRKDHLTEKRYRR